MKAFLDGFPSISVFRYGCRIIDHGLDRISISFSVILAHEAVFARQYEKTNLEDRGEIISIYLLPEYFHQGIGAKLLRASMNGLFTMGYANLCLWVLEDNRSARRFYEKNGFRFNGDIMQYVIGGKPLSEVRYVYQECK